MPLGSEGKGDEFLPSLGTLKNPQLLIPQCSLLSLRAGGSWEQWVKPPLQCQVLLSHPPLQNPGSTSASIIQLCQVSCVHAKSPLLVGLYLFCIPRPDKILALVCPC